MSEKFCKRKLYKNYEKKFKVILEKWLESFKIILVTLGNFGGTLGEILEKFCGKFEIIMSKKYNRSTRKLLG